MQSQLVECWAGAANLRRAEEVCLRVCTYVHMYVYTHAYIQVVRKMEDQGPTPSIRTYTAIVDGKFSQKS